jgi:hypothetical protein
MPTRNLVHDVPVSGLISGPDGPDDFESRMAPYATTTINSDMASRCVASNGHPISCPSGLVYLCAIIDLRVLHQDS